MFRKFNDDASNSPRVVFLKNTCTTYRQTDTTENNINFHIRNW